MKTPWQAVLIPFFLITITACGELNVVSDTLSDTQKQQIKTNILSLYPDMDVKQQQQVADVAVKAIEDLIFVEGGSFEMGDIGAPCTIPSDSRNRIDWSPDVQCKASYSVHQTGAYLHKVTLSAYSISKYETIFADMALMRMVNNLPPPYTKNLSTTRVDVTSYDDPQYQEYLKEKPKSPAPTKTWQNAKDYCLWLGKLTSLPFDLPTEAQWEYAARSRGQNYYFATDTGYRHIGSYFNTITNEYYRYTSDQQNVPIATLPDSVDDFPPNPLGVYGMSNNIKEWVNDWYSPDYYQNSPEYNPQGPDSGEAKVYRDIGERNFTFVRSSEVGFNSYRFFYSFRCALQQADPAI